MVKSNKQLILKSPIRASMHDNGKAEPMIVISQDESAWSATW